MVNFILAILLSAISLGLFGTLVSGVFGILSGAILSAVICFVLLIVPFYLYKLSLGYADNFITKLFVKFIVPALAIFYVVNKVLGLIGIVILALPF